MKYVWGIDLTKACGRAAATLLAGSLIMVAGASAAQAAIGLANREADPVVLTGNQIPGLIGAAPSDIVAFRWDGSWKRVPVQVDERKVADLRVIRQRPMSNPQFIAEVYADPNTWTGADGTPQRPTGNPVNGDPIPGTTGDPNFDQNDEIAMMSRDAGTSAAGENDPNGVLAKSRTPVRASDPLNPGTDRFLYLFRTSAKLDPSAGQDLVSYDWIFSPPLTDGYLFGYDFDGVAEGDSGFMHPNSPLANPEASVVRTDEYEQTFPARWMVDGLKIKVGGATGVDILDGDKSTVGLAGCGRNEMTFSRGGGGAIANIDGPVRAIRSYIGANSGTFTQRDQIYYEGRVDTNTYLRVHPGITDFVLAMDYSEAAFGMIYRNSQNPAGVTINGKSDASAGTTDDGVSVDGKLDWDQATGAQGSLTNVTRVDSSIPGLIFRGYYQDTLSPPANMNAILCSGDTHAIGASGPSLTMPAGSWNTDPTLGSAYDFTGSRTTYYSGPGATAATGNLRSDQVDKPLVLSTGSGIDPDGGKPDPVPPDPGKPGRQNWVGLKVTARPANIKAGIGKPKQVRVSVRNIGDKIGKSVRICPVANSKLVKSGDCSLIRKLKAGNKALRTFAVKLLGAAAGRQSVKVKFRAKASKSHARSATVTLRPTGR